MTMSAARRTFFFDIVNFPAGCNFAVAADDASAAESGETEKPDQTHDASVKILIAIYVPLR